MKELFLIESTKLKCDKGEDLSNLKVTSQDFNINRINDKLQATEADKKPNENIFPSGVCAVIKSSCSPAPIKWQNTSPFEIDGKKELLDS